MQTMACARCSKNVDESITSSCSIGGKEITDYLPNIEKVRFVKLCSFDDNFFCPDCMDLNGLICKDCSAVLTDEEKDILKEQL